jgi:proton-dependent oligopeptide transporter, POT family
MEAASPANVATAQQEFLGHPKGLTYLFTTEMWERFSYYGMRSLLVLYMVKYLLSPGPIDGVIGFASLRAALEWASGPLDIQPLASQIYGLYTGFVYLTPIFGGLLADRVLGQRRTVIIGAVLMALGHFMMAFESLFLFALLALILGNGAFKPNISTQVGRLYAPGDRRRDRAYSVFYVGINIGAFFSPLVCGTLGEELGWPYGFGAAGVGMLIALGIYAFALRILPPDEPRQHADADAPSPRLNPAERRGVIALLLLFLPVTLFWAGYEQQGNTIALWADRFTDRSLDLGFWRGTIPTTWFQAFNPFMIFAFTPFVVALWRHQASRGKEPSTATKIALGCVGLALANLVMAFAAGPLPISS